MELREKLKILDLSPKEEKVLLTLQNGHTTPLSIAKATRARQCMTYSKSLRSAD